MAGHDPYRVFRWGDKQPFAPMLQLQHYNVPKITYDIEPIYGKNYFYVGADEQSSNLSTILWMITQIDGYFPLDEKSTAPCQIDYYLSLNIRRTQSSLRVNRACRLLGTSSE